MNIAPAAQTAFQWMDLLWIPFALLIMERGKKLFTCAFVLSCVLLLRLQVELMQQIGYPNGFFRWLESAIFTRGLVTYALFIGFFMLLAFYSRGRDKNVHIAASITIMIAAFCVSSVVMVL